MMPTLLKFLEYRSPAQVFALGLTSLVLVSTLHYLTGYELSFSLFYLIPVAIVASSVSALTSYLFCGMSAIVWGVVDYASGHHFSNGLVHVWNAGIRLGFFVVTAYLVIELRNHITRERSLANADGLTNSLNVRGFKDACRNMLEFSARYRHPVVLGFIDVDNFKAINDAFGHSEGDRVLIMIAATLSRCVRATDIIGRLGGDEFAIFYCRKRTTRALKSCLEEFTKHWWKRRRRVGGP